MSSSNPAAIIEALAELAAGLKNTPPGGQKTLVVDGKVVQAADLATEVQGYHDLYQSVEDTASAHDKALKARDAAEPSIQPRVKLIREAVKGALGATNPDLAAYGIKPNKVPAPLTADQLAARKAKANATRAARHTMGKAQKKAIKGAAPAPAQPPPASPPPSPAKPGA